jgi:DNA-binding transcriptional LysR family regulator
MLAPGGFGIVVGARWTRRVAGRAVGPIWTPRCASAGPRRGGAIQLDELSAITIFVKVVEENGFSSAARSLDLSTSYVSRQLSALEARLGVRLLNRSTRRQALTPVGALFYRNCASILAQLEEAELAITQMQTVPRGLLRVSAPVAFGAAHVAPAVAEFMGRYTDLEIELALDDRRVDPGEEGFDVVVRLGETGGRDLLSREVAPLARFLVASPGYLVARGRPGSVEELSQHAALLNNQDPTGASWQLHGPGTIETASVLPALSSNHDEVLLAAALGGRGIALLYDWQVGDHVAAGRLERVLPTYTEETVGVHAVYPEQKHLSARVRLFIDLLVERLGPNPPWRAHAAGDTGI